jgi:hypothetical protein
MVRFKVFCVLQYRRMSVRKAINLNLVDGGGAYIRIEQVPKHADATNPHLKIL